MRARSSSLALRAPQPPSLALGRVERLGGLLVRTPPVLAPAVPVDSVGQPGLEVLEPRRPAELGAQLAGLDRVAAGVGGPGGGGLPVVLRAGGQPPPRGGGPPGG